MNDVGYVFCSCCDQKIKSHRWGKTKAEGWFFTKDGKVFCPNHIPDWVSAWRKKKKQT